MGSHVSELSAGTICLMCLSPHPVSVPLLSPDRRGAYRGDAPDASPVPALPLYEKIVSATRHTWVTLSQAAACQGSASLRTRLAALPRLLLLEGWMRVRA